MAKIVMGMSGGVDSTVAALLLKEQGHDVLGVFLRLWKHADEQTDDDNFTQQINHLQSVAEQIKIDFTVVDARVQFRNTVVTYFKNAYQKGITPNPCYLCNRDLKWAVLLEIAEEREYQWAASGHYARVTHDPDGKARLWRGVDEKKDQSYVLSSLRQKQLKKIVLPLGEKKKMEVKALAEHYQLRIANQRESQDICFLPQGDYASFLKNELPDIVQPGYIIDFSSGQIVGQHAGLAFFTIGQRKGLGVYAPEPRYVIDKDLQNNQLIVGKKEHLGGNELKISAMNWISEVTPLFPLECQVEIRYQSRVFDCIINSLGDQRWEVFLKQAVMDITPGQAAVFYRGQEVLGSGIIEPFDGVGGSA